MRWPAHCARPGDPCAPTSYDTGVLRRQAEAVRAALAPRRAAALRGGRPTATTAVVKALASTVDGLEGRLRRASWNWPGRPACGGWRSADRAKTDAELASAVEAGATVNLESLLEIRRLAAVAGVGWPCGLRCGSTGTADAAGSAIR